MRTAVVSTRCESRDSNPDALRRWILSPTSAPAAPPRHSARSATASHAEPRSATKSTTDLTTRGGFAASSLIPAAEYALVTLLRRGWL